MLDICWEALDVSEASLMPETRSKGGEGFPPLQVNISSEMALRKRPVRVSLKRNNLEYAVKDSLESNAVKIPESTP